MKYFEFFRQRIPNLPTPNERGESRVPCIFHKDTDPSLGINVETGKWKCYSPRCPGHRGGDIKKFEKLLRGEIIGVSPLREPIDPGIIEAHHQLLLQSGATLDMLHKKRGLNRDTIDHFKLGWDADRVWIPIADKDGKYINVRKYKQGAPKDKMIAYGEGYNIAALFPVESLESDWVLLCEGETDCMVAWQYGFPALTTTGGADTWREDFNKLLTGKRVFICYDADEAGKAGSRRTAISLLKHAAEVRIVHLPLAGTKQEKDITDYFANLGHTKEDLEALLTKAELVESKVEEGNAPPAEVINLHLSQIGEDEFVNKRVRTHVLIAGKDLAPFQVPYRISYQCEGGEKICGRCGIAKSGGQLEVKAQEWGNELLQMVNVPKEKLTRILSEMAKVPDGCPRYKHEIKEYANIEAVKAIPEIDFNSEQADYVIRSLFYLGHGLKTNHTYRTEAVVMPEPKTQYATALIYNAEPSQDSVERFSLTEDLRTEFAMFKVEGE